MSGKTTPGDDRRRAAEANSWVWLLALPIVISLVTGFSTRPTPELFGLRASSWVQLLFVLIAVACTVIVYRMRTKGD